MVIKYRVVNRLAETDAAYIAGIVDGEGTVSLTRRHRNENRQLVVSVSNTDLELLRFLKESIGAGRITFPDGEALVFARRTKGKWCGAVYTGPEFPEASCDRPGLP